MGKEEKTLFDLRPGNWFRFPNDKERFIKTTKSTFFETEEKEVNKYICVNLSFGTYHEYPAEVIIIRINKQ